MALPRFFWRLTLCFILFLLFFTSSCGNGSSTSSKVDLQLEGKAPDFQLANLNGELIRLSEFEGKVIILNFWATWCAPCRMEIPHLNNLYSTYREQGLSVIGIALDPSGPEILKSFAQELNIDYPILIGNDNISDSYGGIFGIPTTFVVGRDGIIHHRFIGLAQEDVLEKDILALLSK